MKVLSFLIFICWAAAAARVLGPEQCTSPLTAAALLFLLIGSSIHMLLHELGHLAGGLLSGYRLVLFQVGPIHVAADENRRLSFSLENERGGRCVMVPDPHPPIHFLAYNLGGVAANGLACIPGAALLLSGSCLAELFSIGLLFSGLLKLVSNGLPRLSGGIPNDGYTVKLLRRRPEARRDYAVYLRLYAALFWNTEIPVNNYQQPAGAGEEELLYYRGIQELLHEARGRGWRSQ